MKSTYCLFILKPIPIRGKNRKYLILGMILLLLNGNMYAQSKKETQQIYSSILMKLNEEYNKANNSEHFTLTIDSLSITNEELRDYGIEIPNNSLEKLFSQQDIKLMERKLNLKKRTIINNSFIDTSIFHISDAKYISSYSKILVKLSTPFNINKDYSIVAFVVIRDNDYYAKANLFKKVNNTWKEDNKWYLLSQP